MVEICIISKVNIYSLRFQGSQCYTQSTYEIKEANFVTPRENSSFESYNDGMFTLIHMYKKYCIYECEYECVVRV